MPTLNNTALIDSPKTGKDLFKTERALCQGRLDYLCQTVLKFYDWDRCHDELRDWMDENADKRFKLILLPRGHLKTSILTIGKSIQTILQDSEITILLASAVWNNSRSFLSEIKEYLTNKSRLPQLFGIFQSDKWTQENIVVRQRERPNKTPTIDTAGIDKTMTSQHYKFIIADDLVTRENVTTSEQLAKVKNYISDLIKLLEPDGEMIVLGTRWHDSDAYGHIIRNLVKSELGDDSFAVYQRKAIEGGSPIFPKKFSMQILANIKSQIGSYDFSANYDNDPINSEDQHFKPPVRRWTDLGEGAIHAVTFDPATSEKKTACDAVVLDAAVTRANQLCVVEYKAFQKKDPGAMIDKIFEYVTKYKGKSTIKVGIETNGGQEIYIKLIKEEQRKRNIFFELSGIHHTKDKFSRIMALQARWESGNLLLKDGMIELEDQMARFPVAEKVDILDALAMQLEVLTPQFLTKAKVYIPPKYRRGE